MIVALAASLVSLSPPLPPVPIGSGSDPGASVVEGYGQLPISFEPNVGQVPNRYDFVGRGRGFGMAIDPTGATFALGAGAAQDVVRLKLLRADPHAHPQALESLSGKVNYFIGDDPARWHSDVPTFGRVAYRDVLPGIDVTYYGTNEGTLEYDFIVAPGADPTDIRVAFSGATGVALNRGSLVISTPGGAVTQEAPVLYQTIGGRRVPVAGRFLLVGYEVGFEVGAYDRTRPLVIDPTLVYSTFLGESGDDKSYGITVDSSGAAYVTGSTTSASFPTPSFPGFGGYAGQLDAFVSKLDPSGQSLIYSTYLGGSKIDIGYGIAVDSSGAAYVTGSTTSADFPTSAPIQASNAGSEDAFVTKLNAAGSALVYSTYLGGSNGAVAPGVDIARGIAVDSSGAAYVTGSTTSSDFHTQFPFQASNAGGADAFVTKINDKGSGLLYSTYLGGALDDKGNGVAIDTSRAAYVTGSTTSSNFPLQAPFQAANGGSDGAFVTKLNAAGSAPLYSTYLGGSTSDVGYGVDVDAAGAAYVTGSTSSTDFPTKVPFQAANGGSFDAFVTKLNAAGSAATYSTYLGGAGDDSGTGIALDGASSAYVTGSTGSVGFPVQDPFQASNGGMLDAFVTKLKAAGSALVYSTFLGGSDTEFGNGIAVDGSGAYVTGSSRSAGFPVQAPLQGSNAGLADGFITKLKETPAVPCGGQLPTIQVASPNLTTYGTPGTDVISGTSGVDTIYGLGGNDTICGLGGADLIFGGDAGNDTLGGNDKLYGGDGNDKLYGNTGKDRLFGELGADTLNGGTGVDFVRGDAGADHLDGNDGDDAVIGGTGDDTVLGSTGGDTLNGGVGFDILNGGLGHDKLHGGAGIDYLSGGDANDTISGNAGDDVFAGSFGADTMYGHDGNDTFSGGDGNDQVRGGDGKDTVQGNDGNDTLYGDGGNDTLQGNAGNDALIGGPNVDACYGHSGTDTGSPTCETYVP